jgi:hypothetical protein
MSQADRSMRATGSPPSPSTAWKEVVEPDEEKLFSDFLSTITAQQHEVVKERGEPPLRGFHAKLHLGLAAEFHVLPDLPDYARRGVFGQSPRTFDAVVRFSNGDPHVNRDGHKEPRGLAIKLVGVPGKRLPGQEGIVTQDFLATSHSLTSTVRNARQFIAVIEARRTGNLPVELARRVGWLEALRILAAVARTVGFSSVRSMATEEYGGTAPIQFGEYAVKFTLRPAKGTREAGRPRKGSENFLRDELVERLAREDVVFDFFVQFYVNDKHTPIEDTSVRWKHSHAREVRVAQLRIPRCDHDELSTAVDRLSFSPWHTIEDHRPLGSVMRARKLAYPASLGLRPHDPEPTRLPLPVDPPQSTRVR